MEIRPATVQDVSEIVSLLKLSLGESLIPKSAAYWTWKHINNPFGVSPVLLAFEGTTLIGVRAFMRWDWINNSETIEAVRPVDTATHPEFQGRGIFSKLTKALLRDCEKLGFRLLFNTPNAKSLPGYLKMGWVKTGKYPVSIRMVRPLHMAGKFITNLADNRKDNDDGSLSYYTNHSGLPALLLSSWYFKATRFVTAHTIQSLDWRYRQVPVAQYYAAGIESNNNLTGLFFYRIKSSRFGRELRITDVFFQTNDALDSLKQLLKSKIDLHGADYVTCAGVGAKVSLGGVLNFTSRGLGPTVTVRKLSKIGNENFGGFSQWHPSLGDLELF